MKINTSDINIEIDKLSINTANGFGDSKRKLQQKSLIAAVNIINQHDTWLREISCKSGLDFITKSLVESLAKLHTDEGLASFANAMGWSVENSFSEFPNFLTRYESLTRWLGKGLNQEQINAMVSKGGFNDEAELFSDEVSAPLVELTDSLGCFVVNYPYGSYEHFAQTAPLKGYKLLTGQDSITGRPVLTPKGFSPLIESLPPAFDLGEVLSFNQNPSGSYEKLLLSTFISAVKPIAEFFKENESEGAYCDGVIKSSVYFYIKALKQIEVMRAIPFEPTMKSFPLESKSKAAKSNQVSLNLLCEVVPSMVTEYHAQGLFDFDIYIEYFANLLHPVTGSHHFSSVSELSSILEAESILPMTVALEFAKKFIDKNFEFTDEKERNECLVLLELQFTRNSSDRGLYF